MIRILFICHGNICRSPMAEFIFKDMVKKAGLADEFEISSTAISHEEIGNDIYPPAKEILRANGIAFERRGARFTTREDLENYDLIVIMDELNLRNIHRHYGSKYDDKIHLLMEFAGESRDVADPWYTRDFQKTFDDITRGCEGILKKYS